MQKSAIIVIAAAIIIVVAGFSTTLLNNGGSDGETDFAGKPIEIVDNLDNGIVAVGQDSFRWMTYFGLADKCVMVDQNDMSNFLGKSFMYVGRSAVDIDGGNSATLTDADEARKYFTHSNCAITTQDVQIILQLKPSVVVIPAEFYSDHGPLMDAIENAGIKTLAIGYIYTFLKQDTLEMTSDLIRQIDLIAKSLKQETRGQELKNAFQELVNDFKTLTAGITERKTAYVGALSYNGAHGLDSSIPYFMPMALAGVDNILSGTASYEGSGVKTYAVPEISEKMNDGTILFVDASGYYQNTGDQSSEGVAKLFQDNEAYIIADYIWTGMNYDTVFISAYQILHYAYGVINNVELDEKINHVHDLFYKTHISTRNISHFSAYDIPLPAEGVTIFDDMNEFHQIARGNPISGNVSIDADGKLSYY